MPQNRRRDCLRGYRRDVQAIERAPRLGRSVTVYRRAKPLLGVTPRQGVETPVKKARAAYRAATVAP